jgi:acylphosphatase
VRRRYLVQGEVQGVGYRYFAVARARRIGVCGWVRNLPDGRVEAVAEGTAAALAEFEGSLRKGPAVAVVTNVQVVEIPDEVEVLTSFMIR